MAWSHTYGGNNSDEGYALIKTSDGGLALAGKTESFGNGWFDFWLVRTAANGDSLWSKAYGGQGDEVCTAVIQTADGGFALAGYTDSFGAGKADFWFVLTDENGSALAGIPYGGAQDDRCNAMLLLEDGGFVLAGSTASFTAGQTDFWLLRLDENGDSLWAHNYGTAAPEECNTIVQRNDGGFTLGGTRGVRGAGSQTFVVVQTDASGSALSTRIYGGGCDDDLHNVTLLADGGYLLSGFTCSFAVHDYWMVRTNANGDSLWQKNYGGWDYEDCFSVVQTADGGFACAGYAESFGAGDDDFWLLRISDTGDSLWSNTFGGVNADDARALVQSPDGGFVLAGTTKSYGSGGNDFWLVKTAADPLNSIQDSEPLLPSTVTFSGAYPNPFNSSTTIGYSLPRAANITMGVYDLTGRLVERLIEGQQPAGFHSVVWDATAVSAGVYIVKMNADGVVRSNKVAVVK